jgi:hypothetical protein
LISADAATLIHADCRNLSACYNWLVNKSWSDVNRIVDGLQSTQQNEAAQMLAQMMRNATLQRQVDDK